MGKKNKNKKKESISKKGKSKSISSPERPKSLNLDPELLKESKKDFQDVFRFWNDDVYIGHIAVTPDGKISREGKGKYFSDDGYVFSGRWENDVLVEAERVTYPDGSWYEGLLEDGGYVGQSSYHVHSFGTLESNFVDRRPQGLVTFTDKDGNKWQGNAVNSSVTLFPRNHFFDSEEKLLKARKKTASFDSKEKDIISQSNTLQAKVTNSEDKE